MRGRLQLCHVVRSPLVQQDSTKCLPRVRVPSHQECAGGLPGLLGLKTRSPGKHVFYPPPSSTNKRCLAVVKGSLPCAVAGCREICGAPRGTGEVSEGWRLRINQNKREKGREPVLLHFHPSKNTGARGGRGESGDSDGRATLTSKAAAHARSMEERNSVAQRKDDLQKPIAQKG